MNAEAVSPAEERFDRWRKISGAVAAPLAFLILYTLTAEALEPAGRRLSAILGAVAVLWMTEAIPIPVTALLGALLCILFGVADARTVLAPFADPIIFLFIGSFMLARAMTLHALDRRIALSFLSLPWLAGRPARVLAGLGLVTAILSMWVSNTATTAMMLPIALGILGALNQLRHGGPGDLRSWPYASGMVLMIAYAASIGGIGTPVGSPPNLVGIGFIRNQVGVDISFFRWMLLTVPMFLVMGAVLFTLIYLLHRPGSASSLTHPAAAPTGDLRHYLGEQRALLGRWTRGQINTLIAFAIAVSLWIYPGFLSIVGPAAGEQAAFLKRHIPEEAVALLAAILLFILPVSLRQGRFTLVWGEAVRIDWGTILLFGGGLSLGKLMDQTGVAAALGGSITHLTGSYSLWTITAASIAMSIFLSEATSNTATATMIVPVVIALAAAAGVSPLPPALGACIGASYGFMLPVSTPPNAIAYGSGLIPITRMIRAGILFDIAGFFIILGGLYLLCPLLNLM